MTTFIFRLTLRQLAIRRSTLLLLALAAIPVLIGGVFRLANDGETDPEEFTVRILGVLLAVTTVLPLTSVLFGTAALGDELEEGTAVYLLTKPIDRWRILLPKVAASWLLTSLLVVSSMAAGGFLALGGDSAQVVFGFGVALTVGALAYSVVFVLLSLVTTRALIAGLVFVFIWEGAVTGIFEGVRYLSIRHYTLGMAEWLADVQPDIFDAYVGAATAIVLTSMVVVFGLLYADARLRRVEIREAT